MLLTYKLIKYREYDKPLEKPCANHSVPWNVSPLIEKQVNSKLNFQQLETCWILITHADCDVIFICWMTMKNTGSCRSNPRKTLRAILESLGIRHMFPSLETGTFQVFQGPVQSIFCLTSPFVVGIFPDVYIKQFEIIWVQQKSIWNFQTIWSNRWSQTHHNGDSEMSSRNTPWKINMEANNGGFFWFQPWIFQGVGFGLEIAKREIVTSPTLAKPSIFRVSYFLSSTWFDTAMCVYRYIYTGSQRP